MKKELVKNQAAYNVTFDYNVVPEHPVDSVIVLGDFNEWSLEDGYELKKTKSGNFEGKFKIPAGRDYHFRYLVNGNRWANEKDADKYEGSPLHPHIDNSVLSLPAVSETITMSVDSIKKAGSSASPVKKSQEKAEAPKKEKAPKVEAPKASAKKSEEKPKAKAPAKKIETPKSKPAPTVKDDLTKIEGVGPKIAELLNAAGIDTFATLAGTKKTSIAQILTNAGSRYAMHDPTTWPQQSKLAANGKWDQLKKLQDELKGGK
jgi:predicted flap endonuclease-1-like 5' DNA nuclease